MIRKLKHWSKAKKLTVFRQDVVGAANDKLAHNTRQFRQFLITDLLFLVRCFRVASA